MKKYYLLLILIVCVLGVSYIAEKEENKKEPDLWDYAKYSLQIIHEMNTPEFREAWDQATERERKAEENQTQ